MRDVLGTAKSIEKMKEVCQTLKERIQVCLYGKPLTYSKFRCRAPVSREENDKVVPSK